MGKKTKQKMPADPVQQLQQQQPGDNGTPAAPAPAPVAAAEAEAEVEAPLLSADALSKLTQTIQSGFEKAKQQQEKSKGARPEKRENKKKEKKDDGGKGANDSQDRKGGEKGANEKKDKKDAADKKGVNEKRDKKDAADKKDTKDPAAKKEKKDKKKDAKKQPPKTSDLVVGKPASTAAPAPAAADTRGQKRALNGESKPQPQPQPQSQPQVLPRKPGQKRGIDKEALLKEIVELGGTQEDLDLVKDIESDSEVDEVEFKEQKKAEKGLTDELAGFMKEIGLEGKFDVADAESEEEEDEAEEEDEDEEEEDEEDEAMAEAEPPAPAKAPAPPVTTFAAPANPTSKGSPLLFAPRPDWHAFALPALTPPAHPPTPSQLEALHRHAKHLLTAENTAYSTTHLTKSSDRQFLSTIMTSGTLTDKISALTLICQESPLHTTKTLETLLGLARKKSRSQAVSAMGAIKDLFASGVVLPPGRKLRFFGKQPGLGSAQASDLHMLVWAYEDWLKGFFFEVLKTLEALCGDQLEFARTHAVGYVWELLKEKPEQEANLLRLLVNKLGDTDKKVASKVSYLLLKLQSTHPAMKSIIIGSIESEVVFRPGNSAHAKYYAIITLNQTILSTREVDVANRLLNLYFSVFTGLLKKDNNSSSTPAVTGVNAAGLGSHTKFADEDGDNKKKKTSGPPPQRGGKLNRKARLRKEAEEKKEQFVEELNAKLISAVLTGVNRAFPFSQVDDEVFQRHMDTLFRITHSGNFNTSIQALMLIFQVANSKQAVSDRFYRTLYESLLDQRLVTSSKQAMYLNLLFKALKADTQIKRVRAFVKRLLQISTFHQPPFICGVLFLLSELETAVPSLHQLMDTPQETLEDEEEVFRDVPEADGEGGAKPAAAEEKTEEKRVEYDGRKRDPTHANADRSCLWEILPFLNYYHPSVALFASSLLSKRKMPSKPDLGMHTLTHFLDRFVYRNAKSSSSAAAAARGASIMQPLDGGDTRGMVLSTRAAAKSQVPVNSDAFWRRRVEDVPVDEVFFHKYFNQAAPRKARAEDKKSKKGAKDAERDSEEEEEEADEEEVWKALVGSRPELGEADFDDDGAADFDDDDDDDEDMDEDMDEDVDVEEDEDVEVDDDDEGGSDGSDVPGFGDEDADDVWSDEDDVPAALDEAFEAELQTKKQPAQEAEEEGGNDRRKKRRKLKNLPTFASAEDYADMLSD